MCIVRGLLGSRIKTCKDTSRGFINLNNHFLGERASAMLTKALQVMQGTVLFYFKNLSKSMISAAESYLFFWEAFEHI